ncbi:MAG: hypothetical protein H5T69_15245 [Chloroflexi bacterium]|nr:hypothetical protein [Chloroflexota bacterium]
MNDIGTRVRLAESLGLCGRHARQMLRLEQEDLGMTLGNSIIYESLIHLVSLKLHDMRSCAADAGVRKDWMNRLFGGLGAKASQPYSEEAQTLLAPSKGCRVCELSEEAAKHYGDTLVEMLAYDELQEMYERSDGVCLPHLRMILQGTGQALALEYLLSQAETRLQTLEDDLRNLGKKHTESHRNEPMTMNERLAVERAIAFLTGSDPPQSMKDSRMTSCVQSGGSGDGPHEELL